MWVLSSRKSEGITLTALDLGIQHTLILEFKSFKSNRWCTIELFNMYFDVFRFLLIKLKKYKDISLVCKWYTYCNISSENIYAPET